jgi:hypothetical protein
MITGQTWNDTENVNVYIIILLKKTKGACILYTNTINRLQLVSHTTKPSHISSNVDDKKRPEGHRQKKL